LLNHANKLGDTERLVVLFAAAFAFTLSPAGYKRITRPNNSRDRLKLLTLWRDAVLYSQAETWVRLPGGPSTD